MSNDANSPGVIPVQFLYALKNARADQLDELGVEYIAVSTNDRELAQAAKQEWGIDRVPVGWGLSESAAREWGIYLSTAIRDTEPALFAEPATFLVDAAGDVYMAAIHSSPHLRLQWDRVVKAIERAREGYPARGVL